MMADIICSWTSELTDDGFAVPLSQCAATLTARNAEHIVLKHPLGLQEC